MPVAVHCGAQSTADTAALAAHAAEAGAAAVAVIAPPFFPLDERALEAHFAAAAAACAPLPFYVYEFAARSGYAVPVAVVERLRETAPNLRGLKVSDKPWEAVEPYLLDGLDVFIGAGGARRARAGGAARPARCRGSRRCTPRWSPRSCASRRPSARPRPSGCAARSSASRSTAARRRCVARRGVPVARRRPRAAAAGSTDDELAELDLP